MHIVHLDAVKSSELVKTTAQSKRFFLNNSALTTVICLYDIYVLQDYCEMVIGAIMFLMSFKTGHDKIEPLQNLIQSTKVIVSIHRM